MSIILIGSISRELGDPIILVKFGVSKIRYSKESTNNIINYRVWPRMPKLETWTRLLFSYHLAIEIQDRLKMLGVY